MKGSRKRAPWESARWRGGHIRPLGALAYIWWIVSLLTLAFWVLPYALNPEVGAGSWSRIDTVVLTVFFLSLLFIGIAVNKTLPLWRARGSEVHLSPMPGIIGGRLRGTLYLKRELIEGRRLRLELVNLERTTKRMLNRPSGDLFTTIEYLFDTDLEFEVGRLAVQGDRYVIPLDIEIPYDTKDATDNHRLKPMGSRSYFWMLYLYTDLESGRHQLEFLLPVFRTPRSNPKLRRSRIRKKVPGTLGTREGYPGKAWGRIEPVNRGSVEGFVCGPWPGWKYVLPPLVLAGFTVAMLKFIFSWVWSDYSRSAGSAEGILDLLSLGAVFLAGSLIGLGVLAAGVLATGWLVSTVTRRTILFAPGGLLFERCFMGICRSLQVPYRRISHVYKTKSGSSGGRSYFKVILVYNDSKGAGKSRKRTLADYIANQDEALAFVSALKRLWVEARR